MSPSLASFIASTVHGAGRGKRIGTPTINVRLEDIPQKIVHGIYAGRATIEGKEHPAVVHYGPRPVFADSTTFEVHLLDVTIDTFPSKLTITLLEKLRDVQDFDTKEALMEAIQQDILQAKSILMHSL